MPDDLRHGAWRLASHRLALPALVFLTIAAMTMVSVLCNSPYDDEIYNFRAVEGNSLLGLIRLVNSSDVHPPLSYVINKIIFGITGSWDVVRIVGGLLCAASMAYLVDATHGILAPRRRVILGVLLATSSMLIWGASARWYAYFNPLFAVLLGVMLFSDYSRTTKAIVLAVGAIVLFYNNYLAVVAAPILLIVWLARDYRSFTRRDCVVLAICGLIALAVCAPQIWVFIRVHFPHRSNQVSGPVSALVQTMMTVVLGNAVFPFDVLPAAFGAVTVAAVAYLLASRKATRLDWVLLGVLVLGVAAMSVTGLGGKARNSMFLAPLAALLLSGALACLPRWPAIAALVVAAAFQLQGAYNIVAHRDTIKGSYNSHFYDALNDVEQWRRGCPALTIYNHDPVATYLAARAGLSQSSPYEPGEAAQTLAAGTCVVVERTFHGTVPQPIISEMEAKFSAPYFAKITTVNLDPDRYAAIKSRLEHEPLPADYITLDLYRVKQATTVESWRDIQMRMRAARRRARRAIDQD